ncbi:MAG TPA: glycosyl hydrolase, partial [Bacteroidales bacterium]|nr:glycosyl hydrolase [Bacteroidales bacterium]
MMICFPVQAQLATDWPELTVESKPGTRWWWMGNAVDEKNLTYNLEQYARTGLGTLEITPIYGVQGNDSNEVPFLSDRWMQLYKYTLKEASSLGLKVDMNTGTGWPFGGPQVNLDDAASKLLITEYTLRKGESLATPIETDDPAQKDAKLLRLMAYSESGKCLDLTSKVINKKLIWKAPEGKWRLIAAFSGHTYQKVKRAAPGGEGLVMGHFSSRAVNDYLARFSSAFKETGAPVPNNFFNDSYEVYGADWTPDLFEQFEVRRGYKLENYLPQFLSQTNNDTASRIISDYRETLAELLRENFTLPWTKWAHELGSKTRNQAHGSPGNLIDIYASVDIPECEGFGLSDFNIRGLRKDSLTRHNDSDLSMLKYASSAAHISGKRYTSSETFTWLTEHFRTSFSQCKPDLDLMFVSGVNHVYFHGTTYSPEEAAWPGWKFYASVDMSPTNPLWRDARPFFTYISRVQSFLQMGKPDNDFLVYLPVYDMWYEQKGRLLMFDIHGMAKRAPQFIDAVNKIDKAGYDMDYISDNFIRSCECINGKIVTAGGASYKAIILPGVKMIPVDVFQKLLTLASEGATVIFLDGFPTEVPGFGALEKRRNEFRISLQALPKVDFDKALLSPFGKGKIITGKDYTTVLEAAGTIPEYMKAEQHLRSIRRSNPDGYHYFVSALKATDTDEWITLSVPARSVMLFDPLTGKRGKAAIRQREGKTQVRLQLSSGASMILKTFTDTNVSYTPWNYISSEGDPVLLNEDWKLYFVSSIPDIKDTFQLKKIGPW